VHGDSVDRARFTSMLTSIIDYETMLMRDAPFDEYTFFFHVGRRYGGGGMEHSNSSAIGVDTAASLPNITAHEFFHLWNVKRIRPQSLEPLDRAREMWVPSLWFAEGVTNTYASYTLVRTGLWTKSQFLQDLSAQMTELQSRPAHRWQSVQESSLVTWFDKYSLYSSPELSISYYNKGQLLGFGLDLLIRDRTDNRASLDDVMRSMNDQYAHHGQFYADNEAIRTAAEEVIRKAKPGANFDLGDFFRRYISGTDELPYADWLAIAGLTLKISGQHYQVEESSQATARQKQILSDLLSSNVSSSRQPAAARAARR
jgi:predicted metalloprotease with PDZ domain